MTRPTCVLVRPFTDEQRWNVRVARPTMPYINSLFFDSINGNGGGGGGIVPAACSLCVGATRSGIMADNVE